LDEVAGVDAQGFRNSQKRVEADPLLTALDFADVNGMQFGLFCQLLLTHASLNAALPDG
jgi:hypothetical protein